MTATTFFSTNVLAQDCAFSGVVSVSHVTTSRGCPLMPPSSPLM